VGTIVVSGVRAHGATPRNCRGRHLVLLRCTVSCTATPGRRPEVAWEGAASAGEEGMAHLLPTGGRAWSLGPEEKLWVLWHKL